MITIMTLRVGGRGREGGREGEKIKEGREGEGGSREKVVTALYMYSIIILVVLQ